MIFVRVVDRGKGKNMNEVYTTMPIKEAYTTTLDKDKVLTSIYTLDHDTDIDFGEEIKERVLKEIMSKFSMTPTINHKCHSCGATLVIDENKHIFKCEYCGSVYAIGTHMINDRG